MKKFYVAIFVVAALALGMVSGNVVIGAEEKKGSADDMEQSPVAKMKIGDFALYKFVMKGMALFQSKQVVDIDDTRIRVKVSTFMGSTKGRPMASNHINVPVKIKKGSFVKPVTTPKAGSVILPFVLNPKGEGVVQDGEEEIEVKGKKYNCKIYKKGEVINWRCDSAPFDGLVKVTNRGQLVYLLLEIGHVDMDD